MAFEYCNGLQEISLPKSLIKTGCFYNIGINHVTKIILPELTDQIFESGIFAIDAFDISKKWKRPDIVEINLPSDVLYMPKYYTSEYPMSKAKKALLDGHHWKFHMYCRNSISGDIAVALRYLYLYEHGRNIKERIKESWKKNTPAMIESGHMEDIVRLIRSDAITTDILKDMLDEINDAALKAYILNEIRRRSNKQILSL